MIPRIALLLTLLLLSTPAQAMTGAESMAAFVVSATQDAGNPGYNSGSSADDDGGDD